MDTLDSTTKQCSRKQNCINPLGSILPLSEFGKSKSSKDGLRHQCKVCNRYYATRWIEKHPQENRDRVKQWQQDNHEYVLAKRKRDHELNRERDNKRNNDYYHANKHRPDFILRAKASRKKTYEKIKDKKRENKRKWRFLNPEKSRVQTRNRRAKQRAAEGFHTEQDIALQYKSQKGLCWWCGKSVGTDYHVDHRIAIERGGSNWPNNICISCPTCNMSKQDKMPWEWSGRLL